MQKKKGAWNFTITRHKLVLAFFNYLILSLNEKDSSFWKGFSVYLDFLNKLANPEFPFERDLYIQDWNRVFAIFN
jgi:hypothetical protein